MVPAWALWLWLFVPFEALACLPCLPPETHNASAAEPAQQKDSVVVKVAAGTPVEIELRTAVSSKKGGRHTLEFVVVEPVRVEGRTVLKRGAVVRGSAETTAARRWKKKGRIVLALEAAEAADGSRVPLRFARISEDDKSSRAATIGKNATLGLVVAVWLGALFPLGPVSFAVEESRKGADTAIPATERFLVYVAADAEVMVKSEAEVDSRTGPNPPTSAPATQPTPLPHYRFLETARGDFRSNLEESCAVGYRVLLWRRWVLLERTAVLPDRYRYLDLSSVAPSTKALNEAGALGYRQLAGTLWQMEKEPHPRNFQYRIANLKKRPTLPGYRPVAVWINDVIWEREGEADGEPEAPPEKEEQTLRMVNSRRASTLEKEMNRHGEQGYRLLGIPGGVLMEKSTGEETFRYRLLTKKHLREEIQGMPPEHIQGMLKAGAEAGWAALQHVGLAVVEGKLNAAGAEGFRLHPQSLDGPHMILGKSSRTDERYAYRVLEVRDPPPGEELERAAQEGYRPVGFAYTPTFLAEVEVLILEKPAGIEISGKEWPAKKERTTVFQSHFDLTP